MAKVTNTSNKHSRILPLLSKGSIEIEKGQTVEFPDKDLAAIINRPSIKHDIEKGLLKVEFEPAPVEPDPAKVTAIIADGTITASAVEVASLVTSDQAAVEPTPSPKPRGRRNAAPAPAEPAATE